ncbi:unnamed protein product [Rotaria sordida]|uniref:HECT domain-containing protein n=1 Tax=Rotaria sordida TaxID=392033 RepID=A0A815RKA3_9BILA|nr:unnamed protein product [Rotaria sordida]CAF1459174.1 unnamed protein product [Rotaria sordida]CAF1477919.1 unnamed protein product [Rotaria sordida]
MGMAIRKKHYLDLKFPNLLWKQLVREIITLEDIESIDVQRNNNMNDLFSSVMDECRFQVVSSAEQTYELNPGGKDISITGNNFKNYCLYNIIPGYFLSLFTSNELEETVCGKGEIDVELLKWNTDYGGNYSASLSYIQ